MLGKVEALEAIKYTNEQLQVMISRCAKVAEFDTGVKSALLNWTMGTANSFVRRIIDNGSDAWRKLYHRYVPFADDLQHISICELMSLTPVFEYDIDKSFNAIERIIVLL